MPDLGTTNLFDSDSLTLTRCSTTLKSVPDSCNSAESLHNCATKTLDADNDTAAEFNTRSEIQGISQTSEVSSSTAGFLKIKFTRRKSNGVVGTKMVVGGVGAKSLDDYVNDWKARKIASGVPENRCFFPFLVGSPRLAECRVCSNYIYPGDDISCSVRGCQVIFHLKCAKDNLRCSALKKFKCPQHACFVCKGKFSWRCVRCELASDHKCAAWPEKVLQLSERQGWAVCWRHPKDWRKAG